MIEILNYQFLNNTLSQYLISIVVFLLSLIFLKIFKILIIRKFKKTIEKIKTGEVLIKIVNNVGKPFYLLTSLYLAHFFINLPNLVNKGIHYLFIIFVVYYSVKAVQELIDYIGKIAIRKRENDAAILNFFLKLAKGVLWGLAIIIILQNIGYDVTVLVAGLGVGGIAVGFALQNVLSDIFASLSIYLDKPFQVGDFIIIGEDMGTIEKTGIKSTRINTLYGEELIVSNKELTDSRIRNWKKMKKQRVVFSFGVTYETPTEKLRKIPEIVKDIILKIESVTLDRVHFKEFGDFSLNFEVVYFLNSGDYGKYMDAQQEINLQIKERFEEEGIEMAYPTQTVFLKK